MFAGHALLAFALAAGAASLAGCDADRVLAVGVLAGVFGLAPDVDILYAPVGLAGAASLPAAMSPDMWLSTAADPSTTPSGPKPSA